MHYHGYGYEGPGEAIKSFDGARRLGGLGFDTATVPPELTSWWLARPARAILASWDDPAEAVAWLTGQWRDKVADHHMYPDQQTHAPTVEDMAAGSLVQLRSGNDVVWSAWLRGGMYASFSVVCCPNRSKYRPACPLGRADTRPPYATRE